MKQRRRKFTKEFKVEAVRLLEERDKTGKSIAEELGITSGLLYRWRKELRQEKLRAFPGNGNARDEELFRLKKELAIVKEERDILRKAVAIFSGARR